MRVRNVKFNGKSVPDVKAFWVGVYREANDETGLPCDYTRPMRFVLVRDAANRGQMAWFKTLIGDNGSVEFVDVEFEHVNDKNVPLETYILTGAMVVYWQLGHEDEMGARTLEKVELRCGKVKVNASGETGTYENERWTRYTER